MINLTKDKSLQPSGHAIDLLEKTLKASNGFHFHSPIMDSLWGRWLTGEEKGLHTFCSSEDIERRIFHSIPVFIVNNEMSGTNVFCTELKRTIPVPKDKFSSKAPSKSVSKSSEECVQQYKKEECPYVINEEKTVIDVWGAFTVLKEKNVVQQYPSKMDGMPAIFIWMDKIKGEAKTETDCDMLFAKVMLHELAHAFMYSGFFSTDNFFNFYEESFANAYALAKIKIYDNNQFYQYAKDIVLKQPANYALGAKYAESFGVNEISDFMRNWTDIKQRLL